MQKSYGPKSISSSPCILNYCILVWAPGLGINREASKAVCTTTSYTRITATALHCCSPLLPLFYFLLLSPFNFNCEQTCIVAQNIDFSPLGSLRIPRYILPPLLCPSGLYVASTRFVPGSFAKPTGWTSCSQPAITLQWTGWDPGSPPH